MTFKGILLAIMTVVSPAITAASVHYVNVNSTNAVPPYSGWNTAAINIQDAVDVASTNDLVLVTNGVYQTGGRAMNGLLTNRVTVTKPLILKSVNGATMTAIVGNQLPGTTNGDGAVRCVYLARGASLVGFTITGGATRILGETQEQDGGGIWCENANGGWPSGSNYELISSCRIFGNSAERVGGGVNGGNLSNCVLTANIAPYGGAAAFALLDYCAISNNSAGTNLSEGGGVGGCMLNYCILEGNTAMNGGATAGGILNNCILVGNFAARYGGAAAETGSSGVPQLNNCTVVSNTAGEAGGGAYDAILNNCIVFNNNASAAANYFSSHPEQIELSYCCTVPLPLTGEGNITNQPLFVDLAGGNLRMQSNSACINAGNNRFTSMDVDLDGNPRVAGGTVDIGAYEFPHPASSISYAWLQQFGLPTDGSADYSDPDRDGMNNWQEWNCRTDPTDSLSVLYLLPPSSAGTNVAITWQSVAGLNYTIERSGSVTGAFTPLATGIAGQPGTTTFSHPDDGSPGPFFYRVSVSRP
jgi:hypothetical protein